MDSLAAAARSIQAFFIHGHNSGSRTQNTQHFNQPNSHSAPIGNGMHPSTSKTNFFQKLGRLFHARNAVSPAAQQKTGSPVARHYTKPLPPLPSLPPPPPIPPRPQVRQAQQVRQAANRPITPNAALRHTPNATLSAIDTRYPFKLHGLTFDSAFQYAMYHKVSLCDRWDLSVQILQTKDQGELRQISKSFVGFNPKIWDRKTQQEVWKRALEAQCAAHPELLTEVLVPDKTFRRRQQDDIFHDTVIALGTEYKARPDKLLASMTEQTLANGEKAICYWKAGNPLSNWHPSEFTMPVWLPDQFGELTIPVQHTFTSGEQWLMYAKAARMTNDPSISRRDKAFNLGIMKKILRTTDPAEAKAYGRRLRGYVDANGHLTRAGAGWENERRNVAIRGLREKFNQNPDLKRVLVDTGTRPLLESSPYDKTWGTGVSANRVHASDPRKWLDMSDSSTNLLGKVLMELRAEFKAPPPRYGA